MWLSDSFVKEKSINKNCILDKAKASEFSHDNLFHTVLGVMNVKTGVYNSKLDIFRSCEVSP